MTDPHPIPDPPLPGTTWEHCLLWAGALTSWRPASPTGSRSPHASTGPLLYWHGVDHDLVVVLIAAAIHQCAANAGLQGYAVDRVPLASLEDGSVLGALQNGGLRSLDACPAVPGRGAAQRAALLAMARANPRGAARARWTTVRATARDIVLRHAQAAVDARTTPLPRATPPLADRTRALFAAQHGELTDMFDGLRTSP